jgi:hypothetical protein
LDFLKAGTLTVNVNEQVSKTLLPGISMVPASYLVEGSGPNGAVFSRTISSGCSLTIPSLAFGDWTVTVTAKNSGGAAIGEGSCIVTVLSNRGVTANVTVIPYAGLGTLDLTVNWTPAQVLSPSITGKLLSSANVERDLVFAVNGSTGKATYVVGNVSTGYHTLTLKLLDGTVFMKGAVQVVRIVKEQTTTGVFDFTNLGTGSLGVNITPAMADALNVTISGAAATKPLDQSLSLSAAVSNPPSTGTVTYKWYVNGDWVQDGAAFTFGTGWAPGSYRIDATAYSSDGTRAGSATADVAVPVAFNPYVIRQSGGVSPTITTINGETEILILLSGQKALLGSNDINGNTLGSITKLAIERLDDHSRFTAGSGPWCAPYLNFWITDGAGKFAVVANEPSNADFQPLYNNGYNLTFADLSAKPAMIYENADKSWLPNNGVGLTFADLANFMVMAPSPAQLAAGWDGLGTGAPREFGTNIAFGVNWVFGDTLSNYVSGDPGYKVRNAVVR